MTQVFSSNLQKKWYQNKWRLQVTYAKINEKKFLWYEKWCHKFVALFLICMFFFEKFKHFSKKKWNLCRLKFKTLWLCLGTQPCVCHNSYRSCFVFLIYFSKFVLDPKIKTLCYSNQFYKNRIGSFQDNENNTVFFSYFSECQA